MNVPHRKLLLPCTCAGCCAILGVDDWGDREKFPDDEDAWNFEFYSTGGPGTLRYRAKKALSILLGREYHFDCIALDGHGLRQLREFIDDHPMLRTRACASATFTYTPGETIPKDAA